MTTQQVVQLILGIGWMLLGLWIATTNNSTLGVLMLVFGVVYVVYFVLIQPKTVRERR